LRILVLSDIHGNLDALKAILEAVRGWDEVLVLGDLVDYGPEPGEVIDEVRSIGARVVRGNHDHAAAHGVDCRAGPQLHWVSVWFRENVTLKLLGRGDRAYLASLPLKLELDLGPARILAVHASPRDPLYDYLHPWLPPGEALERLEGARGLVLIGHTHHQFARVVGQAILANPGGAGQPRDGDPRAPYLLVDDDGRITLGRVKYPVEAVERKLEALGIPEPYLGVLKYVLSRAEVPRGHPTPERGSA